MGLSSADDEYVAYVSGRLAPLHRFAFTLTGDAHRADDLVQQTITTLYERWARASRAEHLDRYVRTMLVRTFIDEKRRAWARVRLFAEPPEATAGPPEDLEARSVVRVALARVPRRQQAVLILRFFHDLPVDEVAELLGVSPGTVKSQTSHGLAALRRHLGVDALSALTTEG
jgi:RNA polymerase sigma-70 factor (sigma-E family)